MDVVRESVTSGEILVQLDSVGQGQGLARKRVQRSLSEVWSKRGVLVRGDPRDEE